MVCQIRSQHTSSIFSYLYRTKLFSPLQVTLQRGELKFSFCPPCTRIYTLITHSFVNITISQLHWIKGKGKSEYLCTDNSILNLYVSKPLIFSFSGDLVLCSVCPSKVEVYRQYLQPRCWFKQHMRGSNTHNTYPRRIQVDEYK